jgi:hypothetical protein
MRYLLCGVFLPLGLCFAISAFGTNRTFVDCAANGN